MQRAVRGNLREDGARFSVLAFLVRVDQDEVSANVVERGMHPREHLVPSQDGEEEVLGNSGRSNSRRKRKEKRYKETIRDVVYLRCLESDKSLEIHTDRSLWCAGWRNNFPLP